MQHYETDICVVGGGSGGFAAAVRAAQSGFKTILVEKENLLGGTSTVCGVNCWEPVTGAAYGLPKELYERMRNIPGGCGIYHNAMHFCLDDPDKTDFPVLQSAYRFSAEGKTVHCKELCVHFRSPRIRLRQRAAS